MMGRRVAWQKLKAACQDHLEVHNATKGYHRDFSMMTHTTMMSHGHLTPLATRLFAQQQQKYIKATHSWSFCEENPGVTLPLWESVGMRAVLPPIFGIWTIFLPPKIWPCVPFYSDLVGSHFEAPHFQHVDDLFASKFDQIYHFIQILLGPILNFERCTPTDFDPECAPPPPPPPSGENLPLIGLPSQRGRDTKKFPCHDTTMHVHDDVIKYKHFRLTGPLWGEFTGHRVWINGWVNNQEVGDLRRHRAHSDVTVMLRQKPGDGKAYGEACRRRVTWSLYNDWTGPTLVVGWSRLFINGISA